MLYRANNKRDRAFISCLYESGGRIGELAGLRIKHVQFNRYGAVLTVDGKTGMRPIHIVFSAPYLEDWLTVHPLRDEQEAPVWILFKGTEQVAYPALNKMLKTVAKRAGIKKRVYPHLFRHSRSTFLANFLTELQMDEYLGWIPGSSMPKTYVHLSQKNVLKSLLEVYGLKFKSDEKPILIPVVCTSCGKINGPTFDSCIQCGSNLQDIDSTQFPDSRHELKTDIKEDEGGCVTLPASGNT
ncbi:Tyrosine recombinase XerC [uncultured archaeon]|nr:Tyrosine recombinase XerC [uncultured archaeon]